MDVMGLDWDTVVKTIPIYGLKCNISDEAVELVYRTVNRK